jgi:hypothetical protein
MRLPEPGTRPPTLPKIVLTQREVAALLVDSAMLMATAECPSGPDCDNCNAHRLLWWDLCVALDRSLRIELQAHLRTRSVPLPDGPWEDVNADGQPTGR